MSRNSYTGEDLSPQKTPTSNNIISSFLNAFRRKGANSPDSANHSTPRPEDDFRSLPPRSSNHNKNRTPLPQLEPLGGRDAFDRPNLTTSISEPNGFVSEFSPYRRRVIDDDDDTISSGFSLNGAYLNDGTLYYPKHVSPVALELTALDGESKPLHYFLVVQLHHLTWCDVCGELIWGLVYQCLRCSYCRFTCHHHCRHLVDVDCYRRGVEDYSPTNDSNDSQASSSADSADSLLSSSADSSFVSPTTSAAAGEETEILQQSLISVPARSKTYGKVRPKLSNDLFSPTKGIFDDYDESSGDSGHVLDYEGEFFDGCVETHILEYEEVQNNAVDTPKKNAWEVKDDVDDSVEYVGSGGEIWMEGEKCDDCDDDGAQDDDDDDGIDGGNADYFVTARRNLVTVKAGQIKQCSHDQKTPSRTGTNDPQTPKITTKKGSNEKSSKNGSKKEKPNAKSSSQPKKKSSKPSKSSNPSKSQDHVRHINNNPKRVSNPPSNPVIQHPLATLKTPVSASISNGPTIASSSSSSSSCERSSLLPGGQTLNKENLACLVKEFNKRSNGLSLNVLDDGVTVRGFIRVHLDLMRPVNISSDRRLTLRSSADRDSTGKSSKTERTTFHIPQDTVKNLHITSETTVKEVVEALLKKYAVTDHPKKFALFEKTLHISDDGKHAVSSRRLHDFECPLLIFLCWGGEMLDQRKFVLQENETGEILWEAFSLPELHTFLRILDHEEREYEKEVCEKYKLYQRKLMEEMTKLEKNQGFSNC